MLEATFDPVDVLTDFVYLLARGSADDVCFADIMIHLFLCVFTPETTAGIGHSLNARAFPPHAK